MGFDILSASPVNGEEKAEQEEKYYEFVESLNEYYVSGKVPEMASPDIKFSLAMQEKRLRKNGITVKSHFEKLAPAQNQQAPRDIFGSRKFSNEMYRSYYNHHILSHKMEYQKQGKVIGGITDNRSVMFQTSVYRNEGHEITDRDTICCPNCGAINKLKELVNGCQYCGTRFSMTTIFPVVTSYFYNCKKNFSAKKSLRLFKWAAILGALIAAVLMCVFQMMREDVSIVAVIASSIGAMIPGAFFGYVISAIGFLFSMFSKSFRAIPVVSETSGSRKKLENFMKDKDEFFSYEYFMGEAYSMLRTVLLSDNPEELSFYQGGKLPGFCANIMDSVSIGEMAVGSCWQKDGYIYLTVGIYMSDSVLEREKVNVKQRKYVVEFRRKSDAATDYFFSIHKVSCHQCGGSFDAATTRHCPFCDCEYVPDDDEWVICQIKSVKDMGYLSFMS